MDHDGEDDFVVQELPVYLSHALDPNLHLFQYPTHSRPLSVPAGAKDKGKEIKAKWKPEAKRFEIEIPTDMREAVYDPDRGELLGEGARIRDENSEPAVSGATAAAKRKKEKEREKEERRLRAEGLSMKKPLLEYQKLRSEVVPNQTNYMIGGVSEGALYLHPVGLSFQMRPSLDYLDALDEKAKEERRRERSGDDSDDDEMEEAGPSSAPPKEEAGKAVSISLKKSEAEGKYGGGGGYNGSVRHQLVGDIRKEKEEAWQKLSWRDATTSEAAETFESIYTCPNSKLSTTTRQVDFLRKDV